MIKKLLIANRGEIVRRIMRACSDLGIRTVAVFSEADKKAPYLKEADETYPIGPSNPVKSYLNIDALIDAAKKSGADAVHPGYGFLSENASFAEAVVSHGITWVGPSPAVLHAIESKCYCREIAYHNGVPFVPGTLTLVKSVDEIHQYFQIQGCPIVLKLDKGGGGKGIERVQGPDQIKEAFEKISRVGVLAFGCSDCYIEQEILQPRHIEIQFLADHYGNCVCLGERECSVQRRFQKIIEESPSPVVIPKDREALFQYTQELVKRMGYQGAGTMEFLRSAEGGFYFMEVNARLQVEHPVTEFLTGIDIVKNQLKIASGERLNFRQEEISFQGHSIEARVYAEDPVSFDPSPGIIQKVRFPEMNGKYLRVDHAIEEGGNVPPFYDPLLAKVISWGSNRMEAIDRLKKALGEFHIEGIQTTISTNLMILNNPKYISGEIHTGFIGDVYSQ
ncbi:MAG: acetyl/propionyl/methylcrotonyl-CoA carboxylase subunit alpha [bacterium]